MRLKGQHRRYLRAAAHVCSVESKIPEIGIRISKNQKGICCRKTTNYISFVQTPPKTKEEMKDTDYVTDQL